ncbi:DNA topoisomerase IV [Formosa sediminum]|uniref:DNA topoisomerase IV n=1 Tax=Formosa sediminum TaxID=2594004 RepID=A0A516GU37_9FLAO|nr:DNA topoisomerase IV [Formosa sediminum]QDO95023.1 DNA topoisomerase IV [Formosa sediminum]
MKLFFLCLLVVCMTSCYNVERNCTDFKTGHYYSEIIIDGSTFKSEFNRTDKLQIETYDGKIDSSEVRWINDCEVIFKTINPKNRIERKDIHLKILHTTDSSYTFEYSYVGEDKKQKGIAIRAK